MIFPSSKWEKQFYKTLLPETFVEIRYNETDQEALKEAKETDNGTIEYSKPQRIIDNEQAYKEYVTLETSQWGLNGEFALFDSNADVAYISSAISDEKGAFGANPTITISFDTVHEQPLEGLTIDCGNDWPAEMKITTYKDNTVQNIKIITNTETQFRAPIKLSNYNKIVIEFTKWGIPGHRARVHSLYIGYKYVFTKSELTAYSHEQSGDILSGSLSQNKITFSVDNTQNIWNPDDIINNSTYIAEKQQVVVRYGMKTDEETVEWIKGGTLWVYEWSVPSNGLEVSFTIRDQTAFMEETYAGARTGTLYDLCMAAVSQVKLDGAEYYLAHELKDISVTLNENKDYSLSEIWQLSANAACCVMFQDRDGVLRIQPRKRNYLGYSILPFNSYSYPEFTANTALKNITINNRYSFDYPVKGQNQSMQNDLIQSQEQAQKVADWVNETIGGRNNVSGEYRADPRADLFDAVRISSKYGTIQAMAVTDIKYEYTGCFKGTYAGKITDWEPNYYYFDELYVGDEI